MPLSPEEATAVLFTAGFTTTREPVEHLTSGVFVIFHRVSDSLPVGRLWGPSEDEAIVRGVTWLGQWLRTDTTDADADRRPPPVVSTEQPLPDPFATEEPTAQSFPDPIPTEEPAP